MNRNALQKTLLAISDFEYFQEGDCFCLGHLLSDESMTKYNNRDDFLNRLVFCHFCVPLVWASFLEIFNSKHTCS